MTTADAPRLTAVTLSTLAATPATVRLLLTGLAEGTLHATPPAEAEAGDWSLHTVAVHLVDSHRRQVRRIRRMVAEDRPTLAAVDDWESLVVSGLQDEGTEALIEVLAAERASDVPWYASLDAAALGRTGVHSAAAEVSVAHVLNHAAYHDAQHLGQVARLIEVAADAGRGRMRFAGP
ncbi:MAG: DinB family protein [Dehalococcoidia bacterium]|nr:DinB family protein [Dehalococcoidia bacterium]